MGARVVARGGAYRALGMHTKAAGGAAGGSALPVLPFQLAAGVAAAIAGCTVLCSSLRSEAAPAKCSASKPAPSLHCSPRPVISPGQKRKATTLRTIPLEELWADREAVWVSFDGGVYDVTEFLDSHPGGSGRIEMVKGHDLSGAWSVYELHLQRQHIRDLLEVYRIGNLSEADRKRAEQRSEGTLGNYYDEDPERPAARRGELRIPSVHPWNHEPASLRTLTRT